MRTSVTKLGYTEDGFEMVVQAIMPDGSEWYTKILNTTKEPVSLEYMKIMIDNAYMTVARKALEFCKVD